MQACRALNKLPHEVRQLTLYEARMISCSEEELTRRKTFTKPGEKAAYFNGKKGRGLPGQGFGGTVKLIKKKRQ